MNLKHFGKLLAIISFTLCVDSEARRSHTGTELSLYVDKVWKKNITGQGVVVAVVDEGLNFHHEDLEKNYEPRTSYDFVDGDDDPGPVYNGHGTKCAGVIAGKVNGVCKTGIAYNAKIGGIRLFKELRASDTQEAKAFRFKRNLIDIYSNSWGPVDNGFFIRGPGRKAGKALKDGVKKGRKGKGSIFVFSSGNGGIFGDSCAFDGYVNSIYTVAIGAVRKDGRIPRYAEPCAAIMASTFGDETVTCSGSGNTDCVDDFGMTSAAAAMASGIIALALEANKKLTWRDIQHLIVRTSTRKGLQVRSKEWIVNGAGLMGSTIYNIRVGIGSEIQARAEGEWLYVGYHINANIVKYLRYECRKTIPHNKSLRFEMQTTLNRKCARIKYIEQVEVKLSLKFLPRGLMLMYLTSPNGTKSPLLYQRVFDAITRRDSYNNLTVSSLHFWGENPNGSWTVLFKASRQWFRRPGRLSKLEIILHGTKKNP